MVYYDMFLKLSSRYGHLRGGQIDVLFTLLDGLRLRCEWELADRVAKDIREGTAWHVTMTLSIEELFRLVDNRDSTNVDVLPIS